MKYIVYMIALVVGMNHLSAQPLKVDMTSQKLPFTWELPVKSIAELSVESMVPKHYRIAVKKNFVVKVDEGMNLTATAYNGNLSERMQDAKDIVKKNVENGHEITFMDETANSFIVCNKDVAANKIQYIFYGYITNLTNATEYDFESPNYPVQTLEQVRDLSLAFKTIKFHAE